MTLRFACQAALPAGACSETGNVVAAQYSLVWTLPVTDTFVIDAGGVDRYALTALDCTHRAEPAVFVALRALSGTAVA